MRACFLFQVQYLCVILCNRVLIEIPQNIKTGFGINHSKQRSWGVYMSKVDNLETRAGNVELRGSEVLQAIAFANL